MSTLLVKDRPASAKALMDRVLRGGRDIGSEYPLVFDARFGGRLLSIDEDGAARSACGILVRDFLVEGVRVRGGMIGSVVTDTRWRRRGLASQVLTAAEDALREEGCAFSILWAESPDFYCERGYGPIGGECDYALPFELAQRLPMPRGVRPMRPDDARAIHELYERHPIRVCRTLEETTAMLGCPNMVTLVCERDGVVVSYACLGRGMDFGNVIHEWGGHVDDLLSLVRAHLERIAGLSAAPQLFLMAPTSARDLALRMEALGTPGMRGMLGLGKILDRSAAARLLTSLLGPGGLVEPLEPSAEDTFRVQGPKAVGTLDDDGAIALLMGVDEVRQYVAAFLGRFGLSSARLPLEPFAWGLDSI